MKMHLLAMMRLVRMRACFFIRAEYVTYIKFRADPGNFIVLSYVGHSDLHIHSTYYGLPQIWYTLGGPVGVGYATQPPRNPTVL